MPILTKQQIEQRLKALDVYESSVMFSMEDEGDLTTRELFRIINTRNKLKQMLREVDSPTHWMPLPDPLPMAT